MYSFKLKHNGASALRNYCKSRPHLFEIKDKDGGFIVRAGNKNWFNRWFGLGKIILVAIDEEEQEYYVLPISNMHYELNVKDTIEFWAFIDKIRDKTDDEVDVRLFK